MFIVVLLGTSVEFCRVLLVANFFCNRSDEQLVVNNEQLRQRLVRGLRARA